MQIFQKCYTIIVIKKRKKQSEFPPRITFKCCTITPQQYVVRLTYGGGAMIETLTVIVHLLYYALLGTTCINIALLIIIVYILHKQ